MALLRDLFSLTRPFVSGVPRRFEAMPRSRQRSLLNLHYVRETVFYVPLGKSDRLKAQFAGIAQGRFGMAVPSLGQCVQI